MRISYVSAAFPENQIMTSPWMRAYHRTTMSCSTTFHGMRLPLLLNHYAVNHREATCKFHRIISRQRRHPQQLHWTPHRNQQQQPQRDRKQRRHRGISSTSSCAARSDSASFRRQHMINIGSCWLAKLREKIFQSTFCIFLHLCCAILFVRLQ
jgi:hypothetical protein